jgi:predicted dehydrogenase
MRSSATGVDLYDAITMTCKNGATGLVSGAGTLPPGSPIQVDVRIFGSGGMLLIDIERPRLEIHRNGGQREVVAIDHPPGGYACSEPVNTFVDLIRGKPVENRSSALLGSRVVHVLDAAFCSAISGKLQRVED